MPGKQAEHMKRYNLRETNGAPSEFVKTTVYLERRQLTWLRKNAGKAPEAVEQGDPEYATWSQSDIMRRALDQWLANQGVNNLENGED